MSKKEKVMEILEEMSMAADEEEILNLESKLRVLIGKRLSRDIRRVIVRSHMGERYYSVTGRFLLE